MDFSIEYNRKMQITKKSASSGIGIYRFGDQES
jgi:hypothetical protein